MIEFVVRPSLCIEWEKFFAAFYTTQTRVKLGKQIIARTHTLGLCKIKSFSQSVLFSSIERNMQSRPNGLWMEGGREAQT